jgi:hypothetical protein
MRENGAVYLLNIDTTPSPSISAAAAAKDRMG